MIFYISNFGLFWSIVGSEYGCVEDEIFFQRSCYALHQSERPLVWMQAEEECKLSGGHLVSIMSEDEMKVLHYLLTTLWQTDRTETYIGMKEKLC